jgi:hypothetical protein
MGALKASTLMFVALVALVALVAVTGCSGGGSSPPQLVDGSRPAEVPEALADLDRAVMTRTRITAREIAQRGLRSCERLASAHAEPGSAVVERVGVDGASLTFGGGSTLNACDAIAHPFADPDRPAGSPWCGGSVGTMVRGRLRDPRLDLCTAEGGDITAFAFVEPGDDAKWIAVAEGDRREIYEVAGSFPVRVTTVRGLRAAKSAASFDIEEYAADGRKLRAHTLNAAVAG